MMTGGFYPGPGGRTRLRLLGEHRCYSGPAEDLIAAQPVLTRGKCHITQKCVGGVRERHLVAGEIPSPGQVRIEIASTRAGAGREYVTCGGPIRVESERQRGAGSNPVSRVQDVSRDQGLESVGTCHVLNIRRERVGTGDYCSDS